MPGAPTLAQRVRTKYPGAYDDLSDLQLEAAVMAKFPGVYDDLPRTPRQQMPPGSEIPMAASHGSDVSARTQANEQPLSYLGEMAGNVPGSVSRLAQDVWAALPAVADMVSELHPSGMVRRSMSGGSSPLAAAAVALPGQMIEHYGSRYGSDEARARTVRDDPAGMVADLVGGVGMTRAAARARPAVSAASRTVGAAARTIPAALPRALARRAMNAVGLPGGTVDVAEAIRGVMRRDPPAPAAAVPETAAVEAAVVESPSPAVASVPAAAGPSTLGGTPPSASGTPPAPVPRSMSPQRIQNDLGLAARRMQPPARLTEPEYAEAADLVRQGQSPADAVAAVARRQGQYTRETGAEARRAAMRPLDEIVQSMNPDEGQAFLALLKSGKTAQEAVASIVAQRELTATLQTPSPASARSAVAERNATGRWPPGTPGGSVAPAAQAPQPVPSHAPAASSDAPLRSLREPASWIVREKATGKPVLETFDESVAAKVNREKYDVVSSLEHLQGLNKPSVAAPAPAPPKPMTRQAARAARQPKPVPSHAPEPAPAAPVAAAPAPTAKPPITEDPHYVRGTASKAKAAKVKPVAAAKAEPPAEAAAKVTNEIRHVIDTKGAKSAREVQERVMTALQQELGGARQAAKFGEVEIRPAKAYGGKEFDVWVGGEPVASVDRYGRVQAMYGTSDELITALGGKTVEAGKYGAKSSIPDFADNMRDMTAGERRRAALAEVSRRLGGASNAGSIVVEIPGDGTFTVHRTPHAINGVLQRIKSGGVSPWKGLAQKR